MSCFKFCCLHWILQKDCTPPTAKKNMKVFCWDETQELFDGLKPLFILLYEVLHINAPPLQTLFLEYSCIRKHVESYEEPRSLKPRGRCEETVPRA